MADDQLTLTIAKSDEPFDIPSVKYNRVELGKAIDVTVTDTDGNPYDLTGKNIVFVDKFNDESKGVIIDNGTTDNSGKFIRSNDSEGKFKYIFQKNVFQGSGKAQFEFTKDSNQVDATNPFYIDIQFRIAGGLNLDNATYVSDLESLEAHFNSIIKKADQKTVDAIKDFQTKTQAAIDSGQTDISNEVKDAKTKIEDLTNKTQTLVDSLTTSLNDNAKKLSDLQTAWETISKQIQDKAKEEIDKVQSDFASQMADIKAQAEQKVADWKNTNQEVLDKKADKSDVDALSATVKTKADQSSVDTINTALATKANKSDIDAALATKVDKTELSPLAVKKDVDSALANKVDQTALNTALADYDKIADVDAKLATKADKTTVDNINTSLADKANKADVDTALKTKADKKVVDDLTATVSGKADSTALANYDTTADVDKKLADKANKTDLNGLVKSTDLDTKLATKADTTALADYVKSEDLTTQLAAKANKKDVDDLNASVTGKADSTEVDDLKAKITTLQGQNNELTQKLNQVKAERLIVRVNNVADVDKYPDCLVIVDDPADKTTS